MAQPMLGWAGFNLLGSLKKFTEPTVDQALHNFGNKACQLSNSLLPLLNIGVIFVLVQSRGSVLECIDKLKVW